MKDAALIIAVLFLSREQAHREHLRTTSFSKHSALDGFYKDVVDLADKFAEVYQGFYGVIDDIPYETPAKGEIADVLEHQAATIESMRGKFSKAPALQNIIDEISAMYSQTLYKLRVLK